MISLLNSEDLLENRLPFNAKIQQALQVLNNAKIKIALIDDKNQNFLGTITDGDIRRGLLTGLNLQNSIESIIQREFTSVSSETKIEKIELIMEKGKIIAVPLVEDNKLLGLFVRSNKESKSVISNVMVIMAGGKGLRLRPQTEICPKPMLQVAGKPIILRLIEKASNSGIRNFIISINYMGHVIEDYLGDGSKFGVKIRYLREEKELGTAGSLSLLEPIPNEAFYVVNGDLLSDIPFIDLLEFHKSNSAIATMGVREQRWENRFGVIHIDGVKIVKIIEKPITINQINAGVYVLDPSVIDVLQFNTHIDMPNLFRKILESGKPTTAYPIVEPWLDIGREVDLLEANFEND